MSNARSNSRRAGTVFGAVVFVFLLAGACTDEKIVEVERPFFEDPPAAAGGFLGYDEEAASLTICGNCHVGQQSGWEGTAHAGAWETLQASGSAQAFCEGCHTVSERGNVATGEVGWTSTQDPRYHDVQCESCHGPGGPHVTNPDATQPLASLSVDFGEGAAASAFGRTLFSAQQNPFGCADCHEGTHHPFVEQWSQSPHARVVETAAARTECQQCHRGQATLIAWGENADYLEKSSATHLPVVCGVCHDPHDPINEGQLRYPITTVDMEENLCAQCHNRRTAPAAGTHGLEPHAPEADLLVGDAGHFFPGTDVGRGEILGTHGSERNTRSCATCHVQIEEITDQATGNFVLQSVGHLFRPIPCVDAQGIPQPFGVDCPLTTAARSFSGCTGGNCHGSEAAAASAAIAATTRIQRLVDELHELLELVDPNLAAAGGPIDGANPEFTVAEGAFFNLELAQFGNEDFGTNTVLGSSVHNPFLVESLLLTSIQEVEREYGVAASIFIDYDARLAEIRAQAVH